MHAHSEGYVYALKLNNNNASNNAIQILTKPLQDLATLLKHFVIKQISTKKPIKPKLNSTSRKVL